MEDKLIANLVEKVTKGVRKQLRGYVEQTKSEINSEKRVIENKTLEFERLFNISSKIRKDWAAVEMMIEENNRNSKLIYEMRRSLEECRNELMDLKLLHVEIKQLLQLKGLMKL